MPKSNFDQFRKKVDRANRLARSIITFGGYGIIFSIAAILIFLMYQSLPLTFGADIEKMFTFKVNKKPSNILLTGVDQYQEISYVLDELGNIRFYRLSDQSVIYSDSLPLESGEKLLKAAKGDLAGKHFAAGTNKGRLITAEIKMKPHFEGNRRTIEPSFQVENVIQTDSSNGDFVSPIEKLAFSYNEDGVQFWGWQDDNEELLLKIYEPDFQEYYDYNLTKSLGNEHISDMALSHNGEMLIIGSLSGELFWFDLTNIEDVKLKDHWKASRSPITAMNFLIGNNSLAIGDQDGNVQVGFPVRDRTGGFKFREIHRFKNHESSISQIYSSPRDRSFLTIDKNGGIHLNFSTTSHTQLKFDPSQYAIQTAAFAPKSNGIIVVDQKERLGHFKLENPHPETTLKTLFGQVWYEGYPEPEFVWQSTGGSNSFESKFSLIPLIFGTLKGTFYAMLFSIPLALLGAIYVSQFSPKWLNRMVKPTVEIMAALPSVVIGFLAGLYFAPLFERHLTTVFLVLIFVPVALLIGIIVLKYVPEEVRVKLPTGWELLFVLPLTAIAIFLATQLSVSVESALFAGNFKQWIYEALNMTYDQRNSIVVGFALGFAVIPIIFTISEDSLSNVPTSLTSASLALGASRWQTVSRVVLPAAAGGIFAAVMLGLGRAIGETMIVLMATGNTPILDFSPFNGFRAMSANIAVEIPEAPVGGTLYRVLFLTAFLLFIFTFVINTIAAFISDKLREKYSRF